MKLRALRIEAKWTIEQLAAAAGIDPGYLSRAERSKRGMGVERALRVASALGQRLGRTVTVEEIFGDHSHATRTA